MTAPLHAAHVTAPTTTLAATETSTGMRLLVGIVLALGALTLLVTAWLSSEGKLRRNRFVGIRTRRSLASDAAWYAANRAAAPAFYAAGVLLLITAVLGAVLPGEMVRTVVQGVGAGCCVVLALLGLFVGQRAAGEATREK